MFCPDTWILFNSHPQRERKLLNALLRAYESPERIFGLTSASLMKIPGITQSFANDLLNQPRAFPLESEKELMEKSGVRLICITHAEYPENLRLMAEPPPVLYMMGSLSPQDRFAVAVIGSRQHTSYGRDACRKIVSDLATKGITIVSGMARGIDTEAHVNALDAGGRTIAVLGNGLTICYPTENLELMKQIAKGGAVLSEYPMNTEPRRENFPERNGLIAGLSLGVLVVEASERSGSLITVRAALAENRSVYAVPGNIFRRTCEGTNALIRDGAQLVRSADDILEDLAPVLRGMMKQ